MPRRPREPGPRLEALLDARDHLRIRINMIENGESEEAHLLGELRRQLLQTDRDILKYWDGPKAGPETRNAT